ncbi:efflux RND transporter periplasmic adaptor subunit [Gaetbulibacter saemankumensis]|uniref:efflux RND transporter periplasmic adaptor subunit n=1 Tax=Gaetbulibacter saemankumensis TaxID=311208 RepID=UPI0003FD6014|nr:efflux RND transporter periplasmic adaptor subunit [Gaetbulibacter saemankumensis]
MKKYSIYIGILILGVLLGLLFDSSHTSENHSENEATQDAVSYYTCSMHPSVRQTEPGDCPICGMELIPAEEGSDGLLPEQFKLSKNAMALANIQTTMVGEPIGTSGKMMLSGRIVENESTNQTEVSYVSGRIEQLTVNYVGEKVQKGQLVAKIYSPELYAAQQELLTAATLKVSQPALYQAVRNKLKLWKLSEAQIDKIESSGEVESALSIYATISGTVTEKLVNQGDYIKQGQPLFKIANLQSVWANFDVYENQIDQLKTGQLVQVYTKAFGDKVFEGRIDFIDPVLNNKTRTVNLRVVLNNTKGLLKPGMFVSTSIKKATKEANELIVIPASSVLWTGEESVVYLKVKPDEPVFEMKRIILGSRIGDAFEVLDGVSVGDEIVTNGTFTVDAAAQLQGKKSMMNTGNEPISETPKISVSKVFQKEFSEALEAYLVLKDAFVASDAVTISKTADELLKTLQAITQVEVADAKPYVDASIEQIKQIAEAEDLALQREHFVSLNEHMILITQHMHHLNKPLYVQKCPMANNNKGASWLSAEQEIRNPYFGDAMLKCGEVIQTIK